MPELRIERNSMIKTPIAAAMAACALLAAWPAVAAAQAASSAASSAAPNTAALRAAYEKDSAACNKKPAGDARATCLREAGAAYDAARKGQLRSPSDAERNARARCEQLPEAQRNDCLARARGEGESTVQGSVEGGGILRETVTRTITPAPAASAAAETASAASAAASQP
jgi:hypothetical protein